jgi:hypothetical protein
MKGTLYKLQKQQKLVLGNHGSKNLSFNRKSNNGHTKMCDLIYTCNYKKFLTERKESVQVIVIAERDQRNVFQNGWCCFIPSRAGQLYFTSKLNLMHFSKI